MHCQHDGVLFSQLCSEIQQEARRFVVIVSLMVHDPRFSIMSFAKSLAGRKRAVLLGHTSCVISSAGPTAQYLLLRSCHV